MLAASNSSGHRSKETGPEERTLAALDGHNQTRQSVTSDNLRIGKSLKEAKVIAKSNKI